MSHPTYISNNLQKFRTFIIIIELILSINIIFCQNCKNVENLLSKTCYNDLIIFDDLNWRSGHASTNNKNITIVEFSLNSGNIEKRLFYGLKNNGRYYFTNGLLKIDSMTCSGCSSSDRKGRYESRNLFVSLKDDTSKTKQYLFSMSSYYSLVELIDFDNSASPNYYAWSTLTFFDLQRPIFSFEFSLFEIGDTNTYIATFIESGGFEKDENDEDKEYGNTTTITKFELNNFDSNDYRTLFEPTILYDSYNGRVVSAFRLEESNLIVLLYIKRDSDNKKGKYITKFYNTDLTYRDKEFTIYNDVVNLWVGFGIFVKGISIKGDYAAFALYYNGDSKESLYFLLAKYNSGSSRFDTLSETRFESYSFRQDVYSNGLYKLEDDRIVLFTTSDYDSVEYGALHMFLFDFYNNYAGTKIRE